MMKRIIALLIASAMMFTAVPFAQAAEEKMPTYQSASRQMEKLNRGLIAVKTTSAPANGISAGVYLSWRLLGDESLTNQAFDIYRNGVKIYTTGAHDATNYMDTAGKESDTYCVVKKGESIKNAEKVNPSTNINYARGSSVNNGSSRPNAFNIRYIPLVRPANVANHKGETSYYYHIDGNSEGGANDASLGDLDGDGDYEIVLKWNPSNAKDNANSGYTGNVYIDGYEISENNGGYMWRIDLGKNIRAGAHYTQFMVYDFDGNGKSEIAMKTAPGTIDGTGKYVTEVGDTAAIRNADNTAVYLSSSGKVNGGGEYVTIFDGETGEALYTTEGITRGATDAWGDSSNRIDRFLAAVAYIDGVTPHYIECRGYYNAAIVRAYKWDGSTLSLVWEHRGTSEGATSLYGQGNHNLSVADVDNDGRDEIVYGSAVLDDNGVAMGNTKLGHGDAMHVSDFNNDGVQEVFSVKEKSSGIKNNAADFRVAATGENIFGVGASGDTGRGIMINADDEYAKNNPNALSLAWSSSHANMFDLTGTEHNAKPSSNGDVPANFAVYWDGDLGREILSGNKLVKYYENGNTTRFYNDGSGLVPGSTNNGSKETPCLTADLWGDWREEIIMKTGNGEADNPSLLIMTSVIPTTYRLTTLMHDCQYRLAIAWQNVGYNQPPHTSYYIGSAALAVNSAGVTQNYLAPAVPYTVPYYVTTTPVEGISLITDEITLKIGQTYRLNAKFEPENATNKGLLWESDDEMVATAMGGNITAVGEGYCTITVTTRDGGFVDTCRVRVADLETIDALDGGVFTSNSSNFSGGEDYAYLEAVERSEGAYFARSFIPYYENKATLSFTFNTGGQKLTDSGWGWDGHEYTFGLELLDTYGNNILNIAQSYKSSAQATTAKIGNGSFDEIRTEWSSWTINNEPEEDGESIQNPTNRSSTTWYVTAEFDYDADICAVTIEGSSTSSGSKMGYTKTFALNGMSFQTLRYWLTKDGDGYIKVGPSLSNLEYTLTCEKGDAAVQLVSTEDNKVKFIAYDKDERTGMLIFAAYDENGALKFAESEIIQLSDIPRYGEKELSRSVNGYRVGAYLWTSASSVEPVGLSDKTASIVKKLTPVSFAATAEPEAANPAKNALDGNLSTVWASQGVNNITLDLGKAVNINQIKLAFAEYADDRTIPFTVSVSYDNSNWTTVYSGNSVAFSGEYMDFYVLPNQVARYVKLEVEGNSVSGWSSVSELEVYGG